MKLYTEEQMRQCYEGVLQNVGTSIRQSDLPKVDEYINSLTPIEVKSEFPINLPSDEEVEQYLKSFPYTKHLDDGQYNDGVIVGAELAIEWMRSKLVTFKSE